MATIVTRYASLGLRVLLECWLLLAAGDLTGLARADESVFRAGAAVADITPAPGVSLDGPISKNGPVTGVHDPLHARALVLCREEVVLAIVICDMCIIDQEVYDHAKSLVREETGIPDHHMLMAATHTHAAPRVMRIATEPADEAYREQVAEGIAEAILAAHRRLAPAKIGFASFDKPDYIDCRRSQCRPGSVTANPFGETDEQVKSVAGRSNQVLAPAGPVDPQVSVLSVQHLDGRPLAVLANFSVHYCGGYQRGMVSADYFGVFAERLAESVGVPGFVAMMSNGTSGNTGAIQLPVDQTGPWIRIEKSGTALANETVRLLNQIEHGAPDALMATATELTLEVRKPDTERVVWAKQLMAAPGRKGPHHWSRVYAAETLHLRQYPERYAIKLQVIRIGDVAIAAVPCEVFAETGLAIKAQSPFDHTFSISLANGYSGYLPPPQQHAWGGYETWPARSSHLETTAETRIVQRLKQMADELRSE